MRRWQAPPCPDPRDRGSGRAREGRKGNGDIGRVSWGNSERRAPRRDSTRKRAGGEGGGVQELSADEAALLRAVCDNPDEDTPRLVYADWLDEQGGESRTARAEFIRLQVEQYRTTDGPFDTVGERLLATDREM